MKLKRVVLLLLSILLTHSPLWAATYHIDSDHTTVSFKIRHIFTNVVGRFDKFKGKIEYEPGKPETWKAEATIQAESINTNVAARDKHLKSADFFDVEKYPTITFKSIGISDATETNAKLNGVLIIHGVEKPVTLDLQILGAAKDPWGNMVAAFSATTKINRKDFGLTWNKTLETGGVLVGDEVEITLDVAALLMTSKATTE